MSQRVLRLPQQLGTIWRHPLNRGHELAAVRRWAVWQIASRLAPGPILVPFVGNTRLVAHAGETGITGNIYYGLAEYEEMAFTLHLLRSGDRFIDVGANAGAYTVLASGVAGAYTDAFEPIPTTAARLEYNVNVNDIADLVTVYRVGIGSCPGKLRFGVNEDTVNRVATDDETADEFPVETLDRVLAGKAPNLIKIDVEGFEPEVLFGAKETLLSKSLFALIVETNSSYEHYGFSVGDVIGPLFEAGFQPYSYEPKSRVLMQLSGANPSLGNTIFIRDKIAVLERLSGAPQTMIFHNAL